MSKTDVKKYVTSLDKTSLVNLVMELYVARKEAKEFLEYATRPNDNEKFKKNTSKLSQKSSFQNEVMAK